MLYVILYIGLIIVFMIALYFIRDLYISIGSLVQLLYSLESRVISLERQIEELDKSEKPEKYDDQKIEEKK